MHQNSWSLTALLKQAFCQHVCCVSVYYLICGYAEVQSLPQAPSRTQKNVHVIATLCCTYVCLHRCTQTRDKNYPIIQLQSHMTGNGQHWPISIAHHVQQTKRPKCLMLRGEWGFFCLLDYLYSPSLICVTKHLKLKTQKNVSGFFSFNFFISKSFRQQQKMRKYFLFALYVN